VIINATAFSARGDNGSRLGAVTIGHITPPISTGKVFVFTSGSGQHTTQAWTKSHKRYDSASVQALKGNNLLELHPTAKPVQLIRGCIARLLTPRRHRA
jgi:hypothetical protein